MEMMGNLIPPPIMASVEEVAEAASMDGAVAPLWFDLEEVFLVRVVLESAKKILLFY